MELEQLKSNQLDAYLAALTPKSAEFLIREIERDRLAGGNTYPHDFILGKARQILQESQAKCERTETPLRVFCRPFEALLVEETTKDKQKGRIVRSSVERIWNFLQEVAPKGVGQICSGLTEACLADDQDTVHRLSRHLYQECDKALSLILRELAPESRQHRRLIGRLGGEHVLLDMMEIADCVQCAEPLNQHLGRIPQEIKGISNEDLELYNRWYNEFHRAHPRQSYLLLLALFQRCIRATDPLKLMVRISGTSDSEILRQHAAGQAVDAVLHDMELAAEAARKSVVASAEPALVQVQVAGFYNLASALCDVLELNLRGAWGNRLVAMRSSLSSAIHERVCDAPRLVKAALFSRVTRAGGRRSETSTYDPIKVKEAEFAVTLLFSLKPFLSQLTLHADFSRVSSELEQFLEVIAERLLRDVREGDPEERAFATEAYPAAAQLLRTVFDKETSELYLRRVRAAIAPSETRDSA